MPEAIRLFISYAREDRVAAKRLHDELAKHPGIDLWIDQEKLLGGDDWEYEILRALERSDYVLLLLSQQSISKTGYVQREIRVALDNAQKRPPGKRYIVPLRLDESAARHRALEELQYIDLFPDWSGGIERLFKSLGLARFTHCYIACGYHKGDRAKLIPAGAPIPEDTQDFKYVNVDALPEIKKGLVPGLGMKRENMQKSVFIKLWTVASCDWPRSLYRKSDWIVLDTILFSDRRSNMQKEQLAETVVRLWALARELSPYDEDDWRTLRKLIQTPTYAE